MEQSELINELAMALSKAQGKITGALKDSANPFYKSKYADLASIWDACRGPLSENGLAVVQTLSNDGENISITTTLMHSSGQWIRSALGIKPVKSDPQGIGSTITYARRYALAAITGVAQIDDDAEAGMGRTSKTPESVIKFIDKDQADTLRTKLAYSGSSGAMFLEHFKAESIEKFPLQAYQEAINLIDQRIANRAKKEAELKKKAEPKKEDGAV